MKWFTAKKGKCDHKRNVRHLKYHLNDGTPMIETQCLDCGFTDRGHVYANEWKDELVLIINGQKQP